MDEEGGDRSSGDLKAAAAHAKWGDEPPAGGQCCELPALPQVHAARSASLVNHP